ncbi:MAG: nitrous oxide reductase accessory protein NosL [Nitrospirota bacterium]
MNSIAKKILLLSLITVLALPISCSRGRGERPQPVEFTREHSCNVCGMIIVDFPGSKAQVHYKNNRYDTFCSTLDLFLFYHQPDRPANIKAIYVNDMGKADMEHPKGHWIDAETAFYVYGGDIMGPMGEALVPFSDIKAAEEYVKKHGGRIARFDEVKPEMLKPH